MIFELQEDIPFRSVGTDELDSENFDLSWFIFFQSFFFDVPEKVLFICFK